MNFRDKLIIFFNKVNKIKKIKMIKKKKVQIKIKNKQKFMKIN